MVVLWHDHACAVGPLEQYYYYYIHAYDYILLLEDLHHVRQKPLFWEKLSEALKPEEITLKGFAMH